MIHNTTKTILRTLALALTICATCRAWANLVAEWNGDLANNSAKGQYTMSRRDADSSRVTFADGKATLTKHTTDPASQGVVVNLGEFPSKKMSVVVQYSGLDRTGNGNTSLLGTTWGDTYEYLAGVNSSGNTYFFEQITSTASASGSYSSSIAPPAKGKMVVVFSGDSSDHPGMDMYYSTYANDSYGAYSQVMYKDGPKVSNGIFHNVTIGGSIARIGSYHRPGMVVEAVQIFDSVVTFPVNATMTANSNWSALTWDVSLPASPSASSITYVVNVPSTAASTVTLTLDSALTSAKEIIFNVASGKTLYIVGSNAPACQVYINGEGTVSTTKTQILGSAPKVKVSYPAVWELTNGEQDTADKEVDCSNITGDGTMKLISSSGSSNRWRVLPWGENKMWANTLGLDTMENDGVILSEGERCWEIGSLSGTYGIRSDYGSTYGQSQRQVRFTQSRNTTWSGRTTNTDRINNIYVAGANGATEKTLTLASNTQGNDDPLTVEASGSVKLTGTWKGNLTVQGEFGGAGNVVNATAISIVDGATIRADWGATTFNVKPTFAAGIVNVIVSELPAKNTATKIFSSGTSFAAGTYENSYAIVKTADGTSKTCAEISAQADGIYVTATDDAIYAVLSRRPKYAYEFNGSYTSSGETEMTMSGGSIAAGDYAAGAVLNLGSNAGSHYSSGGFSYSANYSYATDWTIVTYAMTPAANQTILSLAGAKGSEGMIGLRYAGSNQVKAFTTSGTDLTGVTLTSDPTAGFHLYAIVYTASDRKVRMSVDGGEFTEGETFTPGSGMAWQFGGIYQGGVSSFAVNATSGQMDSFRFYSCALTKSDLSALLSSDYATVAKIGTNNFPTLGVAVADRASAETVVEVVADCTETAAVALTQNLVLTVASSTSYIVSPVISGAFSVTKQGDGELTFAGASTYSGGTTVSAGVLKRGSATAFGATGSAVTVSGTGTVDMNGTFSSSASYQFTIEGDGAAGHAYALTGATGNVQSSTGIASIALSGDATIGSLNFGDNSAGTCNCTLNGYTLKTTGTVNGYNAKFYYTGTSGDNETVPETDGGTLEIASGTYTANTWNNSGENITLKIDAGATYSANVNSNDRCIFKNVVNNGTVVMNASYTLTIGASGNYSGTGAINNLRLKTGATVIVENELAPVDVTNSLLIDAVYGIDISALDMSSKEAGDKVPLMKAPSAFDLMKLTSVARGSNSVKWLPYAEAGTGDDEGKYILGVELGSYDAELSWNGDSATWSGSSFNGGDNNYSDSALQSVTFADKGESTDPVTVTVSGAKTVKQLAFTADNRNVTLSGDAITAGTVLKGGDGVVTIESDLSVASAITVNKGVLVLNPTDDDVSDVWEASDDGTLVVYVDSDATTTISANITATKLVKRGAGMLVLKNNSNAISQGTIIEAGTIKIDAKDSNNNTGVFGTGSITVEDGATLDVYGCYVNNQQIYVAGDGVGNNGALVNSGGDMGSGSKYWKVELTDDASWGGTGYIHFDNTAVITLNGYTFTKKGNNNFPMRNTTITGPGTIVVVGGTFTHNAGTNTLNDVNLEIASTGTLDLKGEAATDVLSVKDFSWAGTIDATGASGKNATLKVNGTLNVNGSQSIPKLELASGSTVKFATAASALTASSAFTFGSGTVTVAFANGVTPTAGVLIDWSSASLTTAPAGNFILDGDVANTHVLTKSATGLSIAKGAASVTTTSGTTPYTTVIAAVQAAAQAGGALEYITILTDGEVSIPMYAYEMNIKNEGGATITISGVSEEYSVDSSTISGITTYIISLAATEYTWTGADSYEASQGDTRNWSTEGNWTFGSGTPASRAPTNVDTVVFSDGATVTLDSNVTVAGAAVNGTVSISATAKSFNTSGNITGSGSLTLNDVCLASTTSGITVAPAVTFKNDAEIAGSNPITINGNVTIDNSGTSKIFKIWDATHVIAGTVSIYSGNIIQTGSSGNAGALTITGTTTFNGAFEKTGNGTLSLGAVTVAATSAPTITTGSITIGGAITVNDGVTFTIGGITLASGYSFCGGETATIVLPTPTAVTEYNFANDWTGTIELPSYSLGGEKFNNYGNTNSKVKINGYSGWLNWTELGSPRNKSQHNPTLDIVGSFSVTAWSGYDYTFNKVTGSGSMTFTQGSPNSITITTLEIPDSFNGVKVTNNANTAVNIGTLVLPSLPTCDQKILAIGGSGSVNIELSNIKVGNSALPAKYKLERRHAGEEEDGYYVYYYGTLFSVY